MSKLNHSRPVLKDIDFNSGERRFSKASVNGTRLERFTPERTEEIRRQFLLNCAYAELRGKKMPGPPKALRHIIRCAKGMSHTCVSNWILRQADYAEAKKIAVCRENERLARLTPSSTS